MKLEFDQIEELLNQHHLLRNIKVQHAVSHTGVAYDSRVVKPGDLFFCKGNFIPEYLKTARDNGAVTYVSEVEYEDYNDLNCILVSDVTKAMSLLSAAYYEFPQNDLKIIGITGTKGKTSTAYFAHAILNQKYPGKVALFSTIDRIIGPDASDQFKSDLTTPESMNLFHDMKQAVDNGMEYLVMEVSSQAYLRNRVYGLDFDYGIFLNITPDHIGRNEHKDFEDYLSCKKQLMVHSKVCIINADTDRFEDVYDAALQTSDKQDIILFTTGKNTEIADFLINDQLENINQNKFEIKALTNRDLSIEGSYDLNVVGDYNQQNATAAVIATACLGATNQDVVPALKDIVIPGRMQHLQIDNHATVFVDYAHNYASLSALLKFLKKQYHDGKVIVVVGSPGDKGISRRAGFGQALSEQADIAYLTTDDPGFEDPNKIIDEIVNNITSEKLTVYRELDRKTAIKTAIENSDENDVVVLAGKGEDPYQKIQGLDTPWPTDMAVAKEVKRGLVENGKTYK